jgi:hypothetical protein
MGLGGGVKISMTKVRYGHPSRRHTSGPRAVPEVDMNMSVRDRPGGSGHEVTLVQVGSSSPRLTALGM